MAKTSNRQETFNDKAHDQKKKLRAEETRQTESSSLHTNTTNIDTGTAKEEEKNSEKMRNTQQEAERNTLKQTPNCIRLGPAIFFGPWATRRKPERPPKGSANVKKQQATAAQMHLGREANGIKEHGQPAFMELAGSGIRSCAGRATRQKKAQNWGSYPQGDFIFEENNYKKVLFLKCCIFWGWDNKL